MKTFRLVRVPSVLWGLCVLWGLWVTPAQAQTVLGKHPSDTVTWPFFNTTNANKWMLGPTNATVPPGYLNIGTNIASLWTNGALRLEVTNVAGVNAGVLAAGATRANAGTNANTASTLVARDASGNFSAGQITATTVVGDHAGDGSSLSNLNATAFASGTIPTNRLPSSVAMDAEIPAVTGSGNVQTSTNGTLFTVFLDRVLGTAASSNAYTFATTNNWLVKSLQPGSGIAITDQGDGAYAIAATGDGGLATNVPVLLAGTNIIISLNGVTNTVSAVMGWTNGLLWAATADGLYLRLAASNTLATLATNLNYAATNAIWPSLNAASNTASTALSYAIGSSNVLSELITNCAYTAGTGITIAGNVISLYRGPTNTLSVSPGTVETGASTNAILTWTTNGASPTLKWMLTPATNLTSVNSPWTPTTATTTTTSWTLYCTDGTTTNSSTATMSFYLRRYWGTNGAAITSGQLTNLASGLASSATISAGSAINSNITGTAYWYYAYPTNWTQVKTYFGGFEDSGVITTNVLTNAFGYVWGYRVHRSVSPQSGDISFTAQ